MNPELRKTIATHRRIVALGDPKQRALMILLHNAKATRATFHRPTGMGDYEYTAVWVAR